MIVMVTLKTPGDKVYSVGPIPDGMVIHVRGKVVLGV